MVSNCSFYVLHNVCISGVVELFPGTDIGGSDLTIVTLSQKTTTDLTHTGSEEETEREKVTKFVRILLLLLIFIHSCSITSTTGQGPQIQ
jgi:hypothetical protein